LSLTPGQAADITQAAPLLDEVEPDAFIGDKGYDSDALVEKLEHRGITPVIPPKANRKEPQLLQRPEAVPRHRHTLRQARQYVSHGRSAGLRDPMAQLTTRSSQQFLTAAGVAMRYARRTQVKIGLTVASP